MFAFALQDGVGNFTVFERLDTAGLLLRDLKRLLPRLQKQPAPVHDGTGATGFHH